MYYQLLYCNFLVNLCVFKWTNDRYYGTKNPALDYTYLDTGRFVLIHIDWYLYRNILFYTLLEGVKSLEGVHNKYKEVIQLCCCSSKCFCFEFLIIFVYFCYVNEFKYILLRAYNIFL